VVSLREYLRCVIERCIRVTLARGARGPSLRVSPPVRRLSHTPTPALMSLLSPPFPLVQDDADGGYSFVLGDHLAYRFEVQQRLGKGSFGTVVRCLDHCTGQQVAVKVVNAKAKYQKQALIELELMKELTVTPLHPSKLEGTAEAAHKIEVGRDFVVPVRGYFYFRGHLCILMPLCGPNLYETLKADGLRGLPLPAVRTLAAQLVAALAYTHSRKIVMADLKPENVIVQQPLPASHVNALLRGDEASRAGVSAYLIDFGSSCKQDKRVYTYIQSRFYRAPEVMLGMAYGCPIDIFSLGLVCAELFTGAPLLRGRDEGDQLGCFLDLAGMPPPHVILQASNSRRARYFQLVNASVPQEGQTGAQETWVAAPGLLMSARGRLHRPNSVNLQQALRITDSMLQDTPELQLFLDFLRRMLVWDPAVRATAVQLMEHPWLQAEVQALMLAQRPEQRAASPVGTTAETAPLTAASPSANANAQLDVKTPARTTITTTTARGLLRRTTEFSSEPFEVSEGEQGPEPRLVLDSAASSTTGKKVHSEPTTRAERASIAAAAAAAATVAANAGRTDRSGARSAADHTPRATIGADGAAMGAQPMGEPRPRRRSLFEVARDRFQPLVTTPFMAAAALARRPMQQLALLRMPTALAFRSSASSSTFFSPRSTTSATVHTARTDKRDKTKDHPGQQ
jgi:dual specificity tyrosine-phosphorylation-regulated kinase 2/3/4